MNKLNILILEDESLTALYIKQIVEEAAYNVLNISSNADDALKYLSENHIDIILADIKINGDCDGVCFAEKVGELYKLPLIFLTAQIDDETLNRVSDISYCGYIAKPFTSDDILTSLKLTSLKNSLLSSSKQVDLGYGYTYYFNGSILQKNNLYIELTNKETTLMYMLAKANGVCSFDQIDINLWDDKLVGESTRRNLIYKLKKKIQPLEIVTHKGLGIELIKV